MDRVIQTVTWTSGLGAAIGPNQFGQFRLLVGPLPNQSSVAFSATQTYTDGAIVKWDEPTPASGAEPEHPAPTLELAAASGSIEMHMSSPRVSPAAADSTARSLAGAGLVVAILGLLVAARANRRRVSL